MDPWCVNRRQNIGEIASPPYRYPDGQKVSGRLAISAVEALATRRPLESEVEFPSVAGIVAQRGNF
jgi:hypothetical protein